jgi:hypothetical protein
MLIRMKIAVIAAVLTICSTAVFAGADLSLVAFSSPPTLLAGSLLPLGFTLHNGGVDNAKDVVVTITATGGVTTRCENGCSVGTVLAGTQSYFSPGIAFNNPGDVTITATVSSSTPDPDLSNNKTSVIVTVSPDPDVVVSFFFVPLKVDLGLPFSLEIYAHDESLVVAHNVDVTIDFRPDVGIKSLPAGCSSAQAGRVVCHADTLPNSGEVLSTFTLIGPPAYGDGGITFTATATESEQDFDPKSNTATTFTPIVLPLVVTSTANDGSGSLRQAIFDANAAATSGPIRISFGIDEPSANKWKTIHITSPLPAVTASNTQIDGATQSSLLGDTNPDGPVIEISGGGTVDGDGLTLEGCVAEVANLAINGFQRNGVSVFDAHLPAKCTVSAQLHNLFIGTDPTGSEARPNGQRGIGISSGGASIFDCVVSGNARSGVFDLAGLVGIFGNRIGVKAHSDDPLPNGASGIFIGPGGYGSFIGSDIIASTRPGNVIAFNREMGVAIAAGVFDVSVRGNRIWNNGGLGIDIGLDGPTMSTMSDQGSLITAPTLTLAHYDPVSNKTIVEGDAVAHSNAGDPFFPVDFYANDAAGPSGFGEGQRPIGMTKDANFTSATHFHIEFDGDLTGQFITATATNVNYEGFAKPEGTDQGFLTQTSEFSRAIEVR